MKLTFTSRARVVVAWFTLLVTANSSALLAQTIQWCHSIEQAKERAAAESKPILLHFGSADCAPCRNLEQFVFTEPRVAQAINERFVAVKIDTKQQAKLTEQYQVTRIPHDVILSPDGQVAYRRMSPASASLYQEMLTVGSRVAANTSARSQQVVEAMSGLVRDQREELHRSPFYGEQAALAGTVAGWPTANQSTTSFNGTLPPAGVRQSAASAPSEFAHGSHLKLPTPTHDQPEVKFPAPDFQPATALPQISNPFSGSLQSATPPSRGASSQTANADYQEPETARTELATRKVPTTIPNEHHVQQVTANLAPATAPLGLESYCPVTLLASQKWVKGDHNIGCYHRGVLYLFADQAALDRFMTNPDQWSPLLGGFDPVIMAQENRLEPGKRRFGVFCETTPGQSAIVLFSNESNRDRFKQDSEQYLTLIQDLTAKADRE